MLSDDVPTVQSAQSSFTDSLSIWRSLDLEASYSLQYLDAVYVRHFAAELGRWLDCTDATRQFTFKVPQLVHTERILLLAVTCFAARHMREPETAALAHEQCVKLLIPRLNAVNVVADDALLCAIVILRVYEQLEGKFTRTTIPVTNQSLQSWMREVITSDI